MRNFRNYDVYKNALLFVTDTYKLTQLFPVDEKFGLTSQLRRAAVSIPSNIAEGASRESEKEFSRYLEIAIGSSFEVETQYKIASNLSYTNEGTLSEMLDKLTIIQKQLNAFRNKLKE